MKISNVCLLIMALALTGCDGYMTDAAKKKLRKEIESAYQKQLNNIHAQYEEQAKKQLQVYKKAQEQLLKQAENMNKKHHDLLIENKKNARYYRKIKGYENKGQKALSYLYMGLMIFGLIAALKMLWHPVSRMTQCILLKFISLEPRQVVDVMVLKEVEGKDLNNTTSSDEIKEGGDK